MTYNEIKMRYFNSYNLLNWLQYANRNESVQNQNKEV